MKSPKPRLKLALTFWLAVALSVACYFIPYGTLLLYPFNLLATWAHELGHGLTAFLVGGELQRIELFQSLGGVAFSTRPPGSWPTAFIAAGGLVGPTIAGAVVIVFGSRPQTAPWVIYLLAAVVLGSTLVWVANPFGKIAMLIIGGALVFIGVFGNLLVRLLTTQLIGIQCCINSVMDFDYLFTKQFTRDGQIQISDSQSIAAHLGGTYWMWGGLIAVLTLLILSCAFYFAWLRPQKGEQPNDFSAHSTLQH